MGILQFAKKKRNIKEVNPLLDLLIANGIYQKNFIIKC
ncbi:hypothetical protein [Sporosarcina ureae]